MPTNDERREVAAMLRAQAKWLGPRMDAHEFAHYCADAIDRENALRWDQMTLRLADLIEPEERTCRDDGIGVFRCTRCGAFAKRDAVMDCTGQIPLRYCPNCGARVVER